MNKKQKAKGRIIIGAILLLISICVLQYNENSIMTNAEVDKTIGWGIKRATNNMQPDVGTSNKKILEDNGGICLGKDTEKVIYLTFDEGYEAGYTENILNTLKQNDIKATFFITAHYLNTQPDLVKQMIDEGHIVGNHTVNHKSMPEIKDEEIKDEVMKLHQAVYEKFGYEMKYIRPPKGEFSERTLSLSESLGYKNVMWSFAYVDWDDNKQPSQEAALEKIISNLHNGEIMLLHATSKTNSEIMGEMIKKVKIEGYEFRSIDDFVK